MNAASGTGGASLIRADAVHIPLADASVDLIVTSPPYFALRSYQDDGTHYAGQIGSEPTPAAFLAALWTVTAECKRVLKPSGSMFVNLGDKYAGSGGHNNAGVTGGPSQLRSPGRIDALHAQARATRRQAPDRYNQSSDVPAKCLMAIPWRYAIGCIDQLGLILRAEIIWSKPNGLPESVNDRVRRSHEQWFHMVKSPRYYAAVDEVREPHIGGGVGLTWEDRKSDPDAPKSGWRESGDRGSMVGATFAGNPLGKLPGSVWTIAAEPLRVPDHIGVDHYAAFPQELVRRIVLGWSPSGICIECGNGRVPVTDRKPMVVRPSSRRLLAQETGNAARTSTSGSMLTPPESTITGYACACPTPDAPVRPSVILDPFNGTGTVPMVARTLGRWGIGIDLSADYLRLARWRIWRSGHGAKTERRTWTERQGSLW
jgi:DNA modification methylase